MLLERSCEYDQVVIDHPDVPRLDDQAPRLIYIYTYVFSFLDTQGSLFLFCLYACVYARLDNLRWLGGFSRWPQSSLLSTKRRKLHGVYLEIFFASPRIHDLFHLAQRADEINPALTSCMQQEDLMGKIKKLMIKCVQSAKPITAVHKAITKYRLALHLEHR